MILAGFQHRSGAHWGSAALAGAPRVRRAFELPRALGRDERRFSEEVTAFGP